MRLEPLSIVLSSLDDEAAAQQIAAILIAERLAACIQVSGPVTSHYRWQGKVEQAQEWVLTCKVSAEGVERLAERLKVMHPYELPEIVVLAGSASNAYAVWARRETETPGAGD